MTVLELIEELNAQVEFGYGNTEVCIWNQYKDEFNSIDPMNIALVFKDYCVADNKERVITLNG